MRGGWIAALIVTAGPGLGQELVDVPSGQPVVFVESILDPAGTAGLTARFRFVAPNIAPELGHIDFDTALADMDHLCISFALPRTQTNTGPQPVQIVVSMADRSVEFGTSAPDATQFFESYVIENGACHAVAF